MPSSQCWALLCLCSCCFSARRQKPSALEHGLLWKYLSSYVCSKTVSATMTLKVFHLKKKKSLLKENTLQCPGDDALLWLGGLNPVVCPFSFWAMWQLATCVLFLFLSLPLYWWGWCPFGSLRKATVLQENLALASSTAPCFVKRSKRQLIWFSYYSALAAPSARKRRGFPDPPEWWSLCCCWLTGRKLISFLLLFLIFSFLVLIRIARCGGLKKKQNQNQQT